MGYRNRHHENSYISGKIMNSDLGERVRNHCKLLNITISEFMERAAERYLKDAYSEYLNSLSKEDLIKMVMQKGE